MRCPRFAALLVFSLLTLAALRPALAQDDPFMPWPDGTMLTEVGAPAHGLFITMPPGGEYVDPAQFAVEGSDDPLEYALVWMNDGGSLLNFDTVLIGVLDNGEELGDEDFGEIDDHINQLLLQEYTSGSPSEEPVSAYEGDEYEWQLIMFVNDGGREVARFSTYDGSAYYTVNFYGEAGVGTVEQNWAQMMHILGSFRAE
jgi:hypothetical protein